MLVKIGFVKEYELPSGYIANFWGIGQRVFEYNESTETNIFGTKHIKVDLLLFKDVNAFFSNVSTDIKKSVRVPYVLTELMGGFNLVDLCFDRIKQNSEYFSDAIVFEQDIPETVPEENTQP